MTTTPQQQLYAFVRAHNLEELDNLLSDPSSLDLDCPDVSGKTVRPSLHPPTPTHNMHRTNTRNSVESKIFFLHNKKTDCSGYGRKALMYAASQGYADIAQTLIDQGASANVVDEKTGDTALHVAAYKERPDVVAVLMAAGADPSLTNNDGRFPHALASQGSETHTVLMDAYSAAYQVNPEDLDASSDYSDDSDEDDE